MPQPELFVVIRSAGERTLPLCRRIVEKQVDACDIAVVHEVPFEKALRRCFELGLARGAQWTMTLDADVLLRESAIVGILEEASRLPPDHVQVEGRVLDKFLGSLRPAGNRIYRTALLDKVLDSVREDGTEIRPEYGALSRMEALGYPSRRSALVMGIHDYEQYHRDIYRKCFVHAQKHTAQMGQFVPRWRELAPRDPDFQVALLGLTDGLVTTDQATIDVSAYEGRSVHALERARLAEKRPLPKDTIDAPTIERLIRLAETTPPEPAPVPLLERVRQKHEEVGSARTLALALGGGLLRLGTYITERTGS